ncbi:integrase core domain-containing protein [Streptosporangium sp. NPDC023963]|uniref:IS3 family transposase n=1 Tax=Streptosporangium sp. NPDC023963 TaxID=3155608 RepID=UPI0034232781
MATDADARPGIPDLAGRDFTAPAPGMRFAGDIAHIPTWEGFLQPATVIDCCSKKVAGRAMVDHVKTPFDRGGHGYGRGECPDHRGNGFHSDRESNYTSEAFGRKPAAMGARQPVGRTGVCGDNAMAESFFATLKNEWFNRFMFVTRDKARCQVVRYIEGFYNGNCRSRP